LRFGLGVYTINKKNPREGFLFFCFALRNEKTKMFSFKLHTKDERYVPPHSYIIKEEFDPDKVEEQGNQVMDTNQEEDAPFEQFVFQPSLAYDCFVSGGNFAAPKAPQAPQALYFRRDWIPPTLLPLNPGQLNGLESIDVITAEQKFTVGVYMALPLPVHISPVIVLLQDNVPPKASPPRKDRYISWWQSAFQLRSAAFLAYTAAVPYHSSVTNEYPRECYDEEFIPQIAAYEAMHRARIERIIEAGETMENLQRFIEYAEDFSLYYIHTLERYLFKVLIEPHLSAASPLTLEHFLTPAMDRVSLAQCENAQRARQCVVDFFAFHVAATHMHEKRHAGDDYVQRNPIQLEEIMKRITTTPLHELHCGYVDQQTMKEYWMFCDVK
jgi:hypothetical protein